MVSCLLDATAPEELTLDISQDPNIFARHKVYSNALPSKSTASTNAVDVVFTVAW